MSKLDGYPLRCSRATGRIIHAAVWRNDADTTFGARTRCLDVIHNPTLRHEDVNCPGCLQ